MVELLEVTLLILCGPVDRLVWVEVAQTEKLSYIHSMYLCVIICTCVTASASCDACIHTCTCTYGVAAAVWVFGVRLGVCGEERLLCGKEFCLRVCGDEITVQGRIQDFRGGGVPTLYINFLGLGLGLGFRNPSDSLKCIKLDRSAWIWTLPGKLFIVRTRTACLPACLPPPPTS